jgi:hypothetical protein
MGFGADAVRRGACRSWMFLSSLAWFAAGGEQLLRQRIWGRNNALDSGFASVRRDPCASVEGSAGQGRRHPLRDCSHLASVPPIGIVGWAHPITAAGILFPGWGWPGLAATVIILLAMTSRRWSISTLLLAPFWIWSVMTWKQTGNFREHWRRNGRSEEFSGRQQPTNPCHSPSKSGCKIANGDKNSISVDAGASNGAKEHDFWIQRFDITPEPRFWHSIGRSTC